MLQHILCNPLPITMMTYLERKDWDRVRQLLKKIRRPKKIRANTIHVALELGAPDDIIERLLWLKPTLAHYEDTVSKRCALHIAVKMGRSLHCVSNLVRHNFKALLKQDIDGRTPLHVCVYEAGTNIYLELVDALCELALSATGMEDNDGNNPIELAIVAEGAVPVAPEVLDLLHDYTSQYWASRRKKSELYRIATRRAKRRESSTSMSCDGDTFLLDTSSMHSNVSFCG